MIGFLHKKNENWFISYEDIKSKSVIQIEVHPDDALYCLDSDNNTKVLFDIVKIYLHNETLYRGKLIQKIEETVLTPKDIDIILESLKNPNPPNKSLIDAFINYKQQLSNTSSWDEIYEDYSNENYPPFGGPFTDAIPFIEWLRRNFNPPSRKG